MSVYASADWHGVGDLANQILNYLKSDDTLYFLGDAIDRAPDGVEIMKKLLADPRIIYIRGNHEELMEECLPYVLKEINDINYYGGNNYYSWYGNGGQKTAEVFFEHPEWGPPLLEAIRKMPTEQIYHSPLGHDVILEHAGYTPFDIPHRSHIPTWDREHFYDEWNRGFTKEGCPNPDKTFIVHGHTPVQYLKYDFGYKGQDSLTKEEMEDRRKWLCGDYYNCKSSFVLTYCDGHKIDIDLCSVASGKAVLLNLDTFEEIYFQTKVNKEW